MPTPADIAKQNAITAEVRLTGHRKMAGGQLGLSFVVHRDGISDELRNVDVGTRFYIALFEIKDEPGDQLDSDETANLGTVSREAEALETIASASRSYTKQAVLTCKEPAFWRFIEERYGHLCLNEDHAAASVRFLCGVGSRSKLFAGTLEGNQWEHIRGEYLGWRDHDIPVAKSDCQREQV